MNPIPDEQGLQDEILRLETQLASTRSKLQQHATPPNVSIPPGKPLPTFPHPLLLLSDSALPLGSFAFSSGLESYLAHTRPQPGTTPLTRLQHFLSLSLASLASTSLPYLLSAHRSPSTLPILNDTFEASTPCTVARRASVAQGRALLTVWTKSFQSHSFVPENPTPTPTPQPALPEDEDYDTNPHAASTALSALSASLLHPHSATTATTSPSHPAFPPTAHFAPVWGAVTRAMHISLSQAAHVFLFNHAKGVLSAGVRAGVCGPYVAQGLLASGWLKGEVEKAMEENWGVKVEDAGQRCPVVDLWVGRHEVLYSRIFNS
ncbi:hypothetical protein MMC20_004833 [Loxospora ochrophaea]|nr:hypothetical protein [Loxospora ochrophaea]